MSNSTKTYLHPFQDEPIYYPKKNGKECEFCGLSSIAHKHKPGTLPKDYERIEDNPMSNSTQNEPIINGEWGSPAPYKVNRWVKKDSTQNDWAKKLSSLIDDTIENRHDYKGPLVVEDDILFKRRLS